MRQEHFTILVAAIPDLDSVIDETLEWWTEDKWVANVYYRLGTFCAYGALATTALKASRSDPSGIGIMTYMTAALNTVGDYLSRQDLIDELSDVPGGCLASWSNREGHAAACEALRQTAANFRRLKEVYSEIAP